jgi:23S rRNA U2552 (ribose-2'-O)-methylase RlmE/FtsJ
MDAKKAVHAHEKNMHPGKPMTKLAKGGKTNDQMRKLGRNLAKVANQKVSSFKYKSSRGG